MRVFPRRTISLNFKVKGDIQGAVTGDELKRLSQRFGRDRGPFCCAKAMLEETSRTAANAIAEAGSRCPDVRFKGSFMVRMFNLCRKSVEMQSPESLRILNIGSSLRV